MLAIAIASVAHADTEDRRDRSYGNRTATEAALHWRWRNRDLLLQSCFAMPTPKIAATVIRNRTQLVARGGHRWRDCTHGRLPPTLSDLDQVLQLK